MGFYFETGQALGEHLLRYSAEYRTYVGIDPTSVAKICNAAVEHVEPIHAQQNCNPHAKAYDAGHDASYRTYVKELVFRDTLDGGPTVMSMPYLANCARIIIDYVILCAVSKNTGVG